MLEKQDEADKIIHTVAELIKAEQKKDLLKIINTSNIEISETDYDNWNGGIYYFTVFINLSIDEFVRIRDILEKVESELLVFFEVATRHNDCEVISNVRIAPIAQAKIDWNLLSGTNTKEKILGDIEYLKTTMISVATGGYRIQEVNNDYKTKYLNMDKILKMLNISNPNPFKDLWDWYRKWKAAFSTYKKRRAFIRELYSNLIQLIEETNEPEVISITVDLTGWERIERSILEINNRHNEAKKEEQFQVVGLLCRETIITLAQSVYLPEKHPILDGTKISSTDAKRMLDAYIAVELSGSSNEKLRRYAKTTLDLANELTHKRTATKRDSSLTTVATLSLVNFIGTIEGRI